MDTVDEPGKQQILRLRFPTPRTKTCPWKTADSESLRDSERHRDCATRLERGRFADLRYSG